MTHYSIKFNEDKEVYLVYSHVKTSFGGWAKNFVGSAASFCGATILVEKVEEYGKET